MLAFDYPIRPFTFGPRSSPFFRYARFGSWRRGALGVGWGSGPLGAATRSPRRRRPFHFFRDLAFFGDSEDSGFGDTDGRTTTTTTTKPGSPQTPFQEQKIAKILSPKFFLAILTTYVHVVKTGIEVLRQKSMSRAACRRARRPATPTYPNPRPRPHAANCQIMA